LILLLVPQAMLLSHSRMDVLAPRTLNLLSVAQFLDESSRLTPDQAISDIEWQCRVSLYDVLSAAP